jgi:hypothetical protein
VLFHGSCHQVSWFVLNAQHVGMTGMQLHGCMLLLWNNMLSYSYSSKHIKCQGTLTKGEGSLQLTSLFKQAVLKATFDKENIIYFFNKSHLSKEVNCTELSPSVGVP